MIDFARILSHLRVDQDTLEQEDANYILMLEKAAIQSCEHFIEQKLFADEVPDDEYGVVINEQITVGCLLMIAHLYENRTQATPVKLYAIPNAAECHWHPYKRYSL